MLVIAHLPFGEQDLGDESQHLAMLGMLSVCLKVYSNSGLLPYLRITANLGSDSEIGKQTTDIVGTISSLSGF